MSIRSRLKRLVTPPVTMRDVLNGDAALVDADGNPIPVRIEHSALDTEKMFCAALISLRPEQCTDYTTVIHEVTSQYIRFRDGLDVMPDFVHTDLPRKDA